MSKQEGEEEEKEQAGGKHPSQIGESDKPSISASGGFPGSASLTGSAYGPIKTPGVPLAHAPSSGEAQMERKGGKRREEQEEEMEKERAQATKEVVCGQGGERGHKLPEGLLQKAKEKEKQILRAREEEREQAKEKEEEGLAEKVMHRAAEIVEQSVQQLREAVSIARSKRVVEWSIFHVVPPPPHTQSACLVLSWFLCMRKSDCCKRERERWGAGSEILEHSVQQLREAVILCKF